jgi:acyl-CoA synthetase (AMP-forming)/AMP-acid ligase II
LTLLNEPISFRFVAGAPICVVPSQGARLSVEAIVAHARRNLSMFKMPSVVQVMAEAQRPMLPTGKVDRAALVAMLTESTSGRN